MDNKPFSEVDEDISESKAYYTNKPYNKLQVHFVEIESIYDQCTTTFPSQFTLYKHIKIRYIPLWEAITETSTSFSSTRPILKSFAKLSAPGLGFTFRNQSYASTSITFDLTILPFLTDLDGLVYFDIRCRITLVNRVQLAKKLSSQKISTMPVPQKVRGIGT